MATSDGIKIVTPPARIVWGHPGKKRPRTDNNGKPIIKEDGTPAMQYVFGLAINKQQFGPIWQAMSSEAAKGYPQGVPQNFAWKYDDGDDTRPVNGGGVPYAQREGYPGCYVLTIASALENPPMFFKFNAQTGGYDQIAPEAVKTGDWIVAELNIVCNVPEQRTHTPSLYINPTGIEFVGYDKEIQSVGAINPMQAFGGRQHQLPPGVSATPISGAPAGVGMPQMGGMPQQTPMQQPGMMPQQTPMQQPGMMPQQTPMQQPGMMPQQTPMQQPMGGMPAPAHDFVQPGQMPQMGGGMQQQPMQQMPGQMPGMMPQR